MSKPHTPNQTIRIDHPTDLIELVKTCGPNRKPIVDYGVAHGGLGHRPPVEHVCLIQHGSVLEHDDRDFVVRVAAGSTVSELQAVLNATQQFLPIDADDDLTIGEVILHNVYGPLRVGYGAGRDLLLGLHYIDAVGKDIHVGGRTVKNVAGYDVARLFIGSLGELGCVHEVTLRTSALPESVATAIVAMDDATQIDSLLTDLLVSDAMPTALSLEVRAGGTPLMRIGYHGHADCCQAQLQILESWWSSQTNVHINQTNLCTIAQDTRSRAQHRQWRRQATGLVKLIVPPACTGAACQAIVRNFPSDGLLNIDALPADGCLFVGGPMDASACNQLAKLIGAIVEPVGGLWVWYTKPTDTDSIEPFAPLQPDWPWLAALKKTMDPLGLFNPGRFLPIDIMSTQP